MILGGMEKGERKVRMNFFFLVGGILGGKTSRAWAFSPQIGEGRKLG